MTNKYWLDLITKHGEVAKRMSNEVPKVLSQPDLTLDVASNLSRNVEKSAQIFDQIVEKMHEFDLEENLIEAAEHLQGVWDQLSVAAANKVRTMQGLELIEFPDDDED